MHFPQRDPLTHKHFFRSLGLKHAREYSQATHVLALFTFTPTSSDTTLAFTPLHIESNNYFPFFL
jgi:membrane-anchored protein YejM (alkaline phosphatase superfamily)